MATYVLSIKKEYGLNLLNGKSLYEYRRRKSSIQVGDKIILYAISPDKVLIGEFIVGSIVTGTPKEVWEKTKDYICYQIGEVVPYLELGNYPIAFKVSSAKTYSKPTPLSKIDTFFKPPISYCKAPKQLLSQKLI